MNFDFNIGAIVKLGIFGFATQLYKLGKVIEVTPTEVVIVPQLNVCRESDNGPSSFDEYCTADALHEVLHIRRQLIAYWTYAKTMTRLSQILFLRLIILPWQIFLLNLFLTTL